MPGPPIHASIVLCFCLGLFPQRPSALAQSVPQDAAVKLEDNASAENPSGVILPEPLGGLVPRLTSTAEGITKRANLLTGSIGVGGLYTDNAFTQGPKTIDDYQYWISPGFGFHTFGEHTQWMLDYEGGVTLDKRALSNSQQTHHGAADLSHRFTPRLTSEFRQDFSMTNSPFAQIGTNESLPSIGGPGQLSNFAVPAPVTRIGSISSANVAYQLSQHSAMGVSGSFSLLHFQDDEALAGSGGTLIDTTTTTGRGFYLRQISAHQTIGTEYQFQELRFQGGVARTLDHTVYLFDGIALSNDMTLSLYAGPERAHTNNSIVALPGSPPVVFPSLSDQWFVSGGLAFAWRTKRNGLRLSGNRGVTDGGAWAGAVLLNTANLELEKAFGPRWTSIVTLTYSDGHILATPPNVIDRLTTEEGSIMFLYRFTRNLSAMAQYARVQQPYTGAFTGSINSNYNQVQAGFTYQFEKAFPR